MIKRGKTGIGKKNCVPFYQIRVGKGRTKYRLRYFNIEHSNPFRNSIGLETVTVIR